MTTPAAEATAAAKAATTVTGLHIVAQLVDAGLNPDHATNVTVSALRTTQKTDSTISSPVADLKALTSTIVTTLNTQADAALQKAADRMAGGNLLKTIALAFAKLYAEDELDRVETQANL